MAGLYDLEYHENKIKEYQAPFVTRGAKIGSIKDC
jgi:hypothetical protein